MPEKKTLTISEIPEQYDGVFTAKMSNTSVASAEVSGAGATRNVDITPSATNATKGDYNVSINATITEKYNPTTPTKRVPVIFYDGFEPVLENNITNIEVGATAADDRFILGTILNLPADYSGEITLQADNATMFEDLTVSRLGNNFIIYGTKITSTIKGSTNITITIPDDDNGNRNVGNKELHLEVRTMQYVNVSIDIPYAKSLIVFDTAHALPSENGIYKNNYNLIQANISGIPEDLNLEFNYISIQNEVNEEVYRLENGIETKNLGFVYSDNTISDSPNITFDLGKDNTQEIYDNIKSLGTNAAGEYKLICSFKGDNYNIINNTSTDYFNIKEYIRAWACNTAAYGGISPGYGYSPVQATAPANMNINAGSIILKTDLNVYIEKAHADYGDINSSSLSTPEYAITRDYENTNVFYIDSYTYDNTSNSNFYILNYTNCSFGLPSSTNYGSKVSININPIQTPQYYIDIENHLTFTINLNFTLSYTPSSFTFTTTTYNTYQSLTISGLKTTYLPSSTIISTKNSNIATTYNNSSSTSRTIQIHPVSSTKGSYSSSITLYEYDNTYHLHLNNPTITFTYKTTYTFTPSMSTNTLTWNITDSIAAKTVSITGLPSDYTGTITTSSSNSYISVSVSGSGTSRTVTIKPTSSTFTPGSFYVYATIKSDTINICSNTSQRSIPIYIQREFTPTFSSTSISNYNTDTAAKTLTISNINSAYTGTISTSGRTSTTTVTISGSGTSRTVSVKESSSGKPRSDSFNITFSKPSYGWIPSITSKTITTYYYYYFTASFSTTAVRRQASSTQSTLSYTLSNIPSGYSGSITASLSSTSNSASVSVSGSGTSRTISYKTPASATTRVSQTITVKVPSSGYYLSKTTSFTKKIYHWVRISKLYNSYSSSLATNNTSSQRQTFENQGTSARHLYIIFGSTDYSSYFDTTKIKNSSSLKFTFGNSTWRPSAVAFEYNSSANRRQLHITYSVTGTKPSSGTYNATINSSDWGTSTYEVGTFYIKYTGGS